MKTGLVLEGGAMRGIYTAGVLDVFLREHCMAVHLYPNKKEEVFVISKNTGMTNTL